MHQQYPANATLSTACPVSHGPQVLWSVSKANLPAPMTLEDIEMIGNNTLITRWAGFECTFYNLGPQNSWKHYVSPQCPVYCQTLSFGPTPIQISQCMYQCTSLSTDRSLFGNSLRLQLLDHHLYIWVFEHLLQ